MTKITHAPQAVIDELSTIGSLTPSLVLDNIYKLKRFNNTRLWISHQHTGKQLAIINHVFGDERLQPERETKYYVSSEDNDGETVVYFMTDLGIIDCAQYDTVIIYEAGFSKQLAEAIVAEVGGEIKEIK